MQQVNKGAIKPEDEPCLPGGRREKGGDLYREYRHDAVALRYVSIMLLLVRLIVAMLHHIDAPATYATAVRCHGDGR